MLLGINASPLQLIVPEDYLLLYLIIVTQRVEHHMRCQYQAMEMFVTQLALSTTLCKLPHRN
jgi:hypothetical protein